MSSEMFENLHEMHKEYDLFLERCKKFEPIPCLSALSFINLCFIYKIIGFEDQEDRELLHKVISEITDEHRIMSAIKLARKPAEENR